MKSTLVALVLCVFTLSSCSSSSETSTETAESTLDTAAALLQENPSLNVEIIAQEVPDGVNTLTKANGVGDSSPAFQGDVTVVAAGSAIEAEVISVGGKVWVKTSLAPRFTLLDPASIGAPDPARFFAEDTGIVSLLNSATDVEFGDDIRDGSDVLQSVAATIDGVAMARFLPGSDSSGSFSALFLIDAEGKLRSITISGPFYAGASESTYIVTVSPGTGPANIIAP